MESKELTRLNKERWDSVAERYDNTFLPSFIHSMQEKIVSLLDLKEGQRLLDLGCGTGRALRYAASLVNGQGEFKKPLDVVSSSFRDSYPAFLCGIGIDISSKMLEVAKANSSGYKNIHFSRANTAELPFENNCFDLVMCSMSFHHYYNPAQVLNEIYRVLKSNGRIYILDSTTDGLISKMVDIIASKIDRAHVRQYSTQEFRTLFKNAGLKYIGNVPERLWVKIHIGEK